MAASARARLLGCVQIGIEEFAGRQDCQVGHFAAQLHQGTLLLASDLILCLCDHKRGGPLGLFQDFGFQPFRHLAPLFDNPLRLLLGEGELFAVVVEQLLRLVLRLLCLPQ